MSAWWAASLGISTRRTSRLTMRQAKLLTWSQQAVRMPSAAPPSARLRRSMKSPSFASVVGGGDVNPQTRHGERGFTPNGVWTALYAGRQGDDAWPARGGQAPCRRDSTAQVKGWRHGEKRK